ncbi:EPIDERMAL PATTERNING FACTOR-like protein 2 [Macadamia integrifolia]|uniref:EPIDERMAL PATTERNING FACTOR-like protein 2 n=1 Tax=Macadamia integrifolia TaxID=60698 RepID=UPI001C4FE31B|nr:EPIDERMAL PATTERNING FACTOR-like protein 2 [Macadamia integrifolia]
MGSNQDYSPCTHRCPYLIISFFILLVSSSTQVRLMAEGRAVLKLAEVTHQMGSEEKAVVISHIGSRPPRCENKCSSCGHCEAVQVPAVPQHRSGNTRHSSSKVSTIAYSRGEDNSNYKPMSWKCKCGDMIFNP